MNIEGGQRSGGFIELLSVQVILPGRDNILLTERWFNDRIISVTSYLKHIGNSTRRTFQYTKSLMD